MTDAVVDREQWSSQRAFVFSMTAAAVGLGNLWRFPYMVGANGGAPFIVAYLAALILVALPIMMLEVSIGRMAQGGTVASFRQVHRYVAWYGWAVVVLTIVITSYYLVVTGWTLGYALDSASANVREFDEFTGGYNSLWFFLVTTLLAALVLIRGLNMLERLSRMLMPVLLLVVVFLVIAATQADGFDDARRFLLQADFTRLNEGRIWLFAFGQAFYTLAIGQGYLITYGSYIPRKTDVPRAAFIVTGTETLVALLAGWMIFPFVFTYGFQPDEGTQLAFSALPRVFQEMEGGALLAVPFFFLFFAAAFSSVLAGVKVIVAAVAEEFKLPHVRAVIGVTALLVLLGVPSALSFTPLEVSLGGQPFLDAVDQLAGTNVVIASGVTGAGLLCWLVPSWQIEDSLSARTGWWSRLVGARPSWWTWRIVTVGRALPLVAMAILLWRLVQVPF